MPAKQKEVAEESAFKNWINADLVKRMATHIQHHHKNFDSAEFAKLSKELPALELKPRVRLIRDRLKEHLPANYPKALDILLRASLKPKTGLAPLSGFDLWAVTEFIQLHGVKDFEVSLAALHELTKIFTAEFAIRPFIIQEQAKTLKFLHKWAKDENVHVRRLVSEGSRPRLPWGEQIKSFIKDPAPTIELLDKLRYDEELYVRKSVANHLNDISKDHPELAIEVATRWKKEAPAKHAAKIDWIIKHALRTQLKKGNQKALKLLGYESKGKIQMKNLKVLNPKIKLGDHLEFSFTLTTDKPSPVMIDYIIHHRKSNGGTTPKVFKLKTKTLEPKEVFDIQKRHSFKAITTRVYYPGEHHLEIMVNGKTLGKVSFSLNV